MVNPPSLSRLALLAMHTSPLETPGSGDAGGMNVYVNELARAVVRRGIRTDVFTRRAHPDLPAVVTLEGGVRLHHIDAGPADGLPVADQVAFVEEFAAGVVETLGEAADSGDATDLVHSHYWLSGWAGLMVKRKLGIPHAISFHTLGRIKELSRRVDERPESMLRLVAEEELISSADCVVASTVAEANDLMEHYGANPHSLCVSPPGVDREVFSPGDRSQVRRRTGLDGDGPVILFVGRIQPLKGLDVAIDAFTGVCERLPTARMLVVGGPSGPAGVEETEKNRTVAEERGLDVEFRSVVSHHQMADIYRSSDVLIMPSRSESWGLVAVEAQSCGIPVVAARVGGLTEVVAENETGLLVEGWAPTDYAGALLSILEDPGRAAEMGAAGVEWSEQYSWDRTVDRFLELYHGLMNRPDAPVSP